MSTTLAAPELRAIAERIDRCPSVARRSGGPHGTVASYLPGERLVGLRDDGGTIEVHVVMAWGSTVATVEQEVAAAVDGLTDAALALVVDDIDTPTTATTPTAGAAPAPITQTAAATGAAAPPTGR